MKIIRFILISSLIVLVSCNSNRHSEWTHHMDRIVNLHCQATHLREARFSLADSMRFIQDSMIHVKDQSTELTGRWEMDLKKMEGRKTELTNTSRNLSDTIRQVLLDLTGEMTLEEKRIFNDSLTSQTQRMNCENSILLGQN